MSKKTKQNFDESTEDLIKEVLIEEKVQKILVPKEGTKKLQVTIPAKMFLEMKIWALARDISLSKAVEIMFEQIKKNKDL